MQRGSGVFDRSIQGLKKLNDLGYGKDGTGLKLDLVFNPVGGYLPPEQVNFRYWNGLPLQPMRLLMFLSLFDVPCSVETACCVSLEAR